MAALIGKMGRKALNLAKQAASSPAGVAATRRSASMTQRSGGIVNGLAQSWDRMGSGTKAGLVMGTAGIYTASQFSGGISSTTEGGMTDSFYETLTGVPDIDNQVFGMDVSPASLVTPSVLPGQRSAVGVGAFGTAFGGLVGAGVAGSGRRFRGGIKGGILGGVVGVATSLDAAERRKLRMAMQPETINRLQIAKRSGYFDEPEPTFNYPQTSRYSNRMPQVPGSMIFGMYDSRGR